MPRGVTATHTRLPPGSSDDQPVHLLCVRPWRSYLDGAHFPLVCPPTAHRGASSVRPGPPQGPSFLPHFHFPSNVPHLSGSNLGDNAVTLKG